jgi:amidohydrolase
VLSARRDRLRGTVLFVFQPAEEGAPEGETGGAQRMLAEGLFDGNEVKAIYGLHVASNLATGQVGVRSGPMMAASDNFAITIQGRQTHAGRPWQGIDPITVASQVILGANTIISRQTDLATAPAVLSFGSVHGGLRENIVPDRVELRGTIRTFSSHARADIAERLQRTAMSIAQSAGARAEILLSEGTPVLVNEPALSASAIAGLQQEFTENMVALPFITSSEDFAFYAERLPAFFFRLGVTASDRDPATAASNHSPEFMIDEAALKHGVRAFLALLRHGGSLSD